MKTQIFGEKQKKHEAVKLLIMGRNEEKSSYTIFLFSCK